jgi:hypothetical protein
MSNPVGTKESTPVINLFAFWVENYVDQETMLCSLCANRGIVDTRSTAISFAGVKSGKENFCICPNGRTMADAVRANGSNKKTS